MTNRDDSEQLAWDFDAPESDGSSAAVVADEGLASLTPGSERWIAALQPTDADAMRLDKVDVASMSAEAAARRLRAAAPNDPRGLYVLAQVLEQRKDFDGAERALREILERDPEDATALNYLGYMLAERGQRLDEARLDDVCRPERYLARLAPVFDRLEVLA